MNFLIWVKFSPPPPPSHRPRLPHPPNTQTLDSLSRRYLCSIETCFVCACSFADDDAGAAVALVVLVPNKTAKLGRCLAMKQWKQRFLWAGVGRQRPEVAEIAGPRESSGVHTSAFFGLVSHAASKGFESVLSFLGWREGEIGGEKGQKQEGEKKKKKEPTQKLKYRVRTWWRFDSGVSRT